MPRPDSHAELFEVMYTCRAMRRLKPDPVPEEVLLTLVDAAVQSPSGSDSQNWRFVIVRDRATLAQIQSIWRSGWAFYKGTLGAIPARPGEDLDARERSRKAGEYMVEHLHETPALVFVCIKRDAAIAAAMSSPSTVAAAFRHFGAVGTARLLANAGRAGTQVPDGAAYPAVQNLLLAARALGLGAVLTTPHLFTPGQYERLLGIPSDVALCAIVPVGYPKGKFGPVRRPPASAVVSWERYRD